MPRVSGQDDEKRVCWGESPPSALFLFLFHIKKRAIQARFSMRCEEN